MSSGFQPSFPPSPYEPGPSYPAPAPPPKKSSGLFFWLFLLVAVLGGGVLLLCCGGGGGLIYFGTQVMGKQVAEALRGNPVIQEHIGEIQSCEVDFVASSAHEGQDTMVFNIKGTKGSGTLIADTDSSDSDSEKIRSAKLRMPDGREYIVIPE